MTFKQSSNRQADTEPQNIFDNAENRMSDQRQVEQNYQRQSQSSNKLVEKNLLKEDSFQQDEKKKQTSESFRSHGLGSGDEEIPFEQFVLRRMYKLYNLFTAQNLASTVWNTQQIDQYDQIQSVQDLISLIFSESNGIIVQQLLLIIERNSKVRYILQWIFDAVPILFCKELIVVSCKLILAYQTSKNIDPSFLFSHINQNSLLMIHIFNDPSLRFLTTNGLQASLDPSIINRHLETLKFLSDYAETFIAICKTSEKKQEPKRSSKKLNKAQKAIQRRHSKKKSKKIIKMKKSHKLGKNT